MGLFLLPSDETFRYQKIEAFPRCPKSIINCLLSPSSLGSSEKSLSGISCDIVPLGSSSPLHLFLFSASPGVR